MRSIEAEGIIYDLKGDVVYLQRDDCSYYSFSRFCFDCGIHPRIGDRVQVVFISGEGTKAKII